GPADRPRRPAPLPLSRLLPAPGAGSAGDAAAPFFSGPGRLAAAARRPSPGRAALPPPAGPCTSRHGAAAAPAPAAGGGRAGGAAGARGCAEARRALGARGLGPGAVPPALISGEHLRICPQDYTCCSSEMEEQLSLRSDRDFRALVEDGASFLSSTLASRHRRFEEFFRELLAAAERGLQAMFTQTYGRLYAQNARLFQGLFTELRRHQQGARLSLDEALGEFWARLLERMLPLLNPQYQFPPEYLECVARQGEALRPFGDVPRKLRLQVTRAFVAARAFVQGLATGRDVVTKASKLPPSGECLRAAMRMSSCPLCRGTPALKPCNAFCLNVMKGCLARPAELDPEWNRFLDALIQVAERLEGPFNMELAADSIGVKISEGIMYLQENGVQDLCQGVSGLRDPPRPAPARSRRAARDDTKRRFRTYLPEEKPTTAAGTNLDRLVTDVKEKLRLMRGFWVTLPHTLCSDGKVAADVTDEDKCWNGQARGRYLPDVTGDGLVNQINNPEVEVDIGRPDLLTRQHVLQLRVATSRLQGAYGGQDLDFQDTYEDGSGSGGGERTARTGRLEGAASAIRGPAPRTPVRPARTGLARAPGRTTAWQAAAAMPPPGGALPSPSAAPRPDAASAGAVTPQAP
ncbi:LOW QUALITY PROTEIN: glypican-2, partial [Lepidochelys kempii]|uniref:LOW QUALITY PROTEIN: glypican-2 n=1 Tax=Lepidochelys kempii TaxID=8472 RepID=UPI003C6FDDB1